MRRQNLFHATYCERIIIHNRRKHTAYTVYVIYINYIPMFNYAYPLISILDFFLYYNILCEVYIIFYIVSAPFYVEFSTCIIIAIKRLVLFLNTFRFAC